MSMKNFNKTTVNLLAMFFILNSAFGEEPVWEEKFDKSATLEEAGWQLEKKLATDEFKIADGKLKALCTFKPYAGSSYSREIPFVHRGMLTFNAQINSAAGYNHLSLRLNLYNIMLSFRGENKTLERYYNDKWRNVGKVPENKWIKYKMVFDSEQRTVEYYIDDMDNPVMVDQDVKLEPAKDGKNKIYIGNYGLASGNILNELDDIQLYKITEGAKQGREIGSLAMVFRGIAFDYYQLDKIVRGLGVAEFQNYDLAVSLGLQPKNSFHLEKTPPLYPGSMPKYIIFADMPMSNAVPEYVQNMIVDSVTEGSTILILGGLFTLNKGEFSGTPFEKILPVEIGSPWAVLELNKPVIIDTPLEGRPAVRYMHKLKPKRNAVILARAGRYPFVVGTSYGKGKVITCLGMPCGQFSAAETPFWEWAKWPEFIDAMVLKNLDEDKIGSFRSRVKSFLKAVVKKFNFR